MTEIGSNWYLINNEEVFMFEADGRVETYYPERISFSFWWCE
jgi:hypothetical protein